MKKQLVSLFRKLSRSKEIIHQLENTVILAQQENLALQLLSPLISNHTYFPWTSSSISPSTANYIVNDILINERKKIIEFGSGLSTIIIGRFLKKFDNDSTLFSVESDEKWIETLQSFIDRENLGHHIQFIHAPIKNSPYSFKSHTAWYDSQCIEEKIEGIKFDMVIVDGPQGFLSYSRYGALPFIKKHLNPKFSILLDDTNRKEEQEIFQKWSQEFPNLLTQRFVRFSIISSGDTFSPTPFLLEQIINPS
ncbi:MAG: hypothetical protein WA004_17170 [Saprospiraceae bacterium]